MSDEASEDNKARVVLRHYTSISSLESIEAEMLIRASDQHTVFAVRAKGNAMSPRDAERSLGIKRGRGNAYVDFFVTLDEVTIETNALTQTIEYKIKGDVDLTARQPSFHYNR